MNEMNVLNKTSEKESQLVGVEVDKRLVDHLQGKNENYVLPLFWVRGEEEEIITQEIEKIYDSGIQSFCVESRPHEDFCGKIRYTSFFSDLKPMGLLGPVKIGLSEGKMSEDTLEY